MTGMDDHGSTEDRRCPECGTPVESLTVEPHHEDMHRGGYMVTVVVATTLHPCGHGYIKATGAVLG